ncbi:uncharacterized protein PG986_014426 [Apiospora aurea]|uniref:BZIP domain-containing protein n=1 Tax=Apiospora aurea TaxID=335848 RepID=A0ABR1PT12_9PEZI
MTPNQYSAPQKHCFLSLEQTSRGLVQDFRPCRAQTGRNRITQRNYRKKLKRGLEGFEMGSDTNSTPVGAKNQAEAPRKENKTLSMKSDSNVASFNAPQPESQCIPAMYIDHERLFPPSRDILKGSHTPPYRAYSNLHPLSDEMMMSPLSPHGINVLYARPTTAEAYTATTVPCTLSSITHFIDAINEES